jgi:CHAT domain-containing protein/tetratricopeptide (TPR) repeat protein
MIQETDGQALISAFFQALEARLLDQCQVVLDKLRSLSQTQPAYVPWCAYFEGILANERDHNVARAEQIFSELAESDIDEALRGRALLALGVSYDYQGRWDDAIRTYHLSLPVFVALNQPFNQAKAWKEIAIAYRKGFSRGDFGDDALECAITSCDRALEVLRTAQVATTAARWLEATIWNTLGTAHMHLRRWDEAIRCYQQRLDLGVALNDRFGIGLAQCNLGEIYQLQGAATWPQALDAYQQALAIYREFNDNYEEADALANLASLYHEMGDLGAALEYAEQASAIIEQLRSGISTETARAGFFATIVDTYANTILFCIEAGRLEQAFNYIERARSRAFLDMLYARSPVLSKQQDAAILTLADIQAALPPDGLVLEYFTTGLVEVGGRTTSTTRSQRHRFPPPRTLIVAVTHNTIEAHIAPVSPNDILPQQIDSVVERHFLGVEIRRKLYQRLIAPVAHLLPGRRRLYLVPHGPLHYIPYQALIAPDGTPLLHEHGPECIYGLSATLLFQPRSTNESDDTATCLALGYNGDGDEQLRFAEAEARTVAQLTGGQATVGIEPKQQMLYDHAADYRLLHFSCHGTFDPDNPLDSRLYLAQGEALTALAVMEHMRLRCSLVTLSACESGLSRIRRGDELVGFVRAFLYTGAQALVATLWRVDECSTWLLMGSFYERIQQGSDVAEALKGAQLWLRNLTRAQALERLWRIGTALKSPERMDADDYDGSMPDQIDGEHPFADPYYWSPFILIQASIPR